MDILKFDTAAACDNAEEIELLDPVQKKPTGIFISVVGKDSSKCQEYSRGQIDEALRKAHRAKKRGNESEIQTSQKLRDSEIAFIANCIVGWRQDKKNTITFGKDELACNLENITKLLTRLPWIAGQLDEAIGDLALFMKI